MSNILPLFPGQEQKLYKLKRCSVCRKDFPLSHFSAKRPRHPSSRDVHQSRCKACFQSWRQSEVGRASLKRGKAKYVKTAHGRAQMLFYDIKGRAARFNLEFDLTQEWIRERISSGFCEISGLKFDLSPNGITKFNPYAPSVDRIDSHRGYTKDNCRVICWALNAAFGEWGEATFFEILSAYLNHVSDREIK